MFGKYGAKTPTKKEAGLMVMPKGKYKGRLLRTILFDKSYLRWFADEAATPELRAAINVLITPNNVPTRGHVRVNRNGNR